MPVDLSILDLPIAKLTDALHGLDYDQLSVLYDAEEGGKTRKGALAAIAAARELVSVDDLEPASAASEGVSSAPPPAPSEDGSAKGYDMTSPAARYAHDVSYAQALKVLGPDHPMVLTHPGLLAAKEAEAAPKKSIPAPATTVRSKPYTPEPPKTGARSIPAPAPATPKPPAAETYGVRSKPYVEKTGTGSRSIPVPSSVSGPRSTPAPERKVAAYLVESAEQLEQAGRLIGAATNEIRDPALRGKLAEARGIVRHVLSQL